MRMVKVNDYLVDAVFDKAIEIADKHFSRYDHQIQLFQSTKYNNLIIGGRHAPATFIPIEYILALSTQHVEFTELLNYKLQKKPLIWLDQNIATRDYERILLHELRHAAQYLENKEYFEIASCLELIVDFIDGYENSDLPLEKDAIHFEKHLKTTNWQVETKKLLTKYSVILNGLRKACEQDKDKFVCGENAILLDEIKREWCIHKLGKISL